MAARRVVKDRGGGLTLDYTARPPHLSLSLEPVPGLLEMFHNLLPIAFFRKTIIIIQTIITLPQNQLTCVGQSVINQRFLEKWQRQSST